MTRVRSSPITNEVDDRYNRVGLALAIFAALFLFIALWGLNGFFTARTVVAIGELLHRDALSWGTGWLVHVVVSLIEHHLWKLRQAIQNAPLVVLLGVYALIVVVGVLDVLTSAVAFLVLFNSFGVPLFNQTSITVSTIFAEIIAIIPEGIIVWLTIALVRVIRDGEAAYA